MVFILLFKLIPFIILSLMAISDHFGRFSVLVHSHRLFTEYTKHVFDSQYWKDFVDIKETRRNMRDSDLELEKIDDILDLICWNTGGERGRSDTSELESYLSDHVLASYHATQIFVDMAAATIAGGAIILVEIYLVPSQHMTFGQKTYLILVIILLIYLAMGIGLGSRSRQCFLSCNPINEESPTKFACPLLIKNRMLIFVVFNILTMGLIILMELWLPASG
jgi:hypothetical protein